VQRKSASQVQATTPSAFHIYMYCRDGSSQPIMLFCGITGWEIWTGVSTRSMADTQLASSGTPEVLAYWSQG
jgi:hypothetical protein